MINPYSIVGAVLGFVFGIFFLRSFFFAIIFALLGSSLGSSIGIRYFRGSRRSSGGPQWFSGWTGVGDGQVFMETLFSMLGRLAAADGEVSQEEERIFKSVVINELHITNPQSIQAAMSNFHSAARSSEPITVNAKKAAGSFANRPQLLEMMLIIMIRVCALSNGIHPNEDRLLLEIAGIFGYTQSQYESIKSRYTFGNNRSSGSQYQSTTNSNLKEAYTTLGVPEGSSESIVRRAYRKKAAEYHPDKIAAKGLPEEFTQFANGKFQEIQKAWETIRKSRGF